MTPEQQLEELIDGMDPVEAMLVLLRWLFVKTAEIEGALNAMTPVVGAMAGKLGLTAEDLLRLNGLSPQALARPARA